MIRHFLLIVVSLSTLATVAKGEHRVALLICNPQDRPDQTSRWNQVKRRFEARGFRCQVLKDVENEKALRDAIESFAARTPTLSTAALYFQGQISEGRSLLASDMRSQYALEKVLLAFQTRGGSRRSLLFFDVSSDVRVDEFPESIRSFHGDTETLLKRLSRHEWIADEASSAVSTPDSFAIGKQAGDEWVNNMGIVFVWCPPGTYVSGSPESFAGRYADEEQHPVTIEQGFWLSKYELPFGQPVAKRRAGNKSIARHKLDPMTMINHDDAKSMTRRLTLEERERGRLPDDWQYSLPTEAQWEYAARAGTTSPYYFGDDLSLLPLHANFADKTYYDSGDIYSNAAHRTLDDGVSKLAQVGSYRPNPWGFHDMYGNVSEWCINGAIRGGSWTSVPESCRSAYRDSFSSRNQQNFIGYRLVIQKEQQAGK